MANYKVTDSELASIANAIRAKADISKQLRFPTEFVSEIANLPLQAVIAPLAITANGTYNPPSGVDGYAPVTVSVSGGGTGNILYGYTEPESSLGDDGAIYLKISDDDSYDLPDAYDRLEYLEANGNQSIDTGVDLTATSFFELEASFTINTTNNNVYGLGYSKKESNVMVTSSLIYNQVGSRNITIPFDQNKHFFSWKNASINIDNTVGTPGSNFPLGNRIRLFATAYGGDFNNSRISYAKIYHCKIYNSDTVIREFIPAKRNSDDVLGMYDLVNAIFYTNSGTGDFVAGPIISDANEVIKILVKVNGAWQELLHTNIDDVDVSGGGGDTYAFIVATYPSGATCTATNDSITFTAPDTSGTAVFAVPTPSSIPETWTITATLSGSSHSDIVSVSSYGESYDVAIADVLPYSYKEVEYIEVGSTAGPYIQTGVQLSDTAYFEIKAKYTDTPMSNTWLFGAWASYKDTILGYYNSKIRYMVGGTGNDVAFDTDIHIYSANATGLYIDDLPIGTPNWSRVPTNLTYYLFNIHGQNTPTKNVRVYYCKIWSNGNIVRTLIPCYRKADNVPGMYDVTNGVFYINYGTGSFILGPEV